jgi:hypothetical protein
VTLAPPPQTPESSAAARRPTQNFAYATTGSDQAVYQIPLQAAMDLENTVNRLHSDNTTHLSGKPVATATTPLAASHKK